MKRNILLVAALFVGAIAAGPIKKGLAQAEARNLARQEAATDCELPPIDEGGLSLGELECPCEFSELPGLGAGLSQGFSQVAQAT